MLNNAIYNIFIGYLKIFIFTLSSLYITKILIKYLGTDLYGSVVLFSSFNKYIGLIVMVITTSVSRFVSFEYFKNNLKKASEYYSTAFYSLLAISILIFILFFIFDLYIEKVFNLPMKWIRDIRIFFLFSVCSFLLMAISSIFNIGMTIKHLFYVNDLINLFAKILQLLFIVIAIYLFHKFSLLIYGWSIFIFSIIIVFLGYFFSKNIIELTLKISDFSFFRLKEMGKMGFAALFNNLGMLLYTSSDIIIINLLLGASYVGNYGIALQVSFLIPMIGSTFSRIFIPYITELVSKNKRQKLVDSLRSYSYIFLMIIGLVFSVIVVFSPYILYFWLGVKYKYLYVLVILLSIYQLLHQSTVLTFTYITIRNKLKLPSIITFMAGIVNIILSIILIKYTNLGIYGAVVATIITVFLKTVVFNVIYASYLIKIKPLVLWIPIIKGLSLPIFYSVFMFVNLSFFKISSIWCFIILIFLFSIVYLFIAYFFIFSKSERKKIILLFKLNKLVKFLKKKYNEF